MEKSHPSEIHEPVDKHHHTLFRKNFTSSNALFLAVALIVLTATTGAALLIAQQTTERRANAASTQPTNPPLVIPTPAITNQPTQTTPLPLSPSTAVPPTRAMTPILSERCNNKVTSTQARFATAPCTP